MLGQSRENLQLGVHEATRVSALYHCHDKLFKSVQKILRV